MTCWKALIYGQALQATSSFMKLIRNDTSRMSRGGIAGFAVTGKLLPGHCHGYRWPMAAWEGTRCHGCRGGKYLTT